MEYVNFAKTIACDLDDATQYSTIRTHGVVNGLPEGTPVATLVRARVMDKNSPRWRLYDIHGELLYSWKFALSYQSLTDSVGRVLANKEVIRRVAFKFAERNK